MNCTKSSFQTKEFADFAIDKLKFSKREKKPIRSYQCEKCGMWHLTSQYKKITLQQQLELRIRQLNIENNRLRIENDKLLSDNIRLKNELLK